jgi:hypothetical protein
MSPASVLHLSLWQVFREYKCLLRSYAGLCRLIDIRRFGETYHCHFRGSSHCYRNHWLLRMKAVLSIETPGINNPDIQRNKAGNTSAQYLKRGNLKSGKYLLSYHVYAWKCESRCEACSASRFGLNLILIYPTRFIPLCYVYEGTNKYPSNTKLLC